MFRQIHILIGIVLLSLAVGCGPSEAEQQDQLKEAVLAVHDEIMPKMDDIHRLEKALLARVEDLRKDSVNLDPDAVQALEKMVSELKSADEAMMQWMRNFQPAQGKMTHEDYMKYLEAQKQAIDQVKTQMLESINRAENQLQ